MPRTLHIAARVLAALGAVALSTGCRTPTIRIEAPGDVSRYRTWDFAAPARLASRVPVRARFDFASEIERRIESELSDRGFARAGSNPDLRVHFELALRAQRVERSVTGAVQHLPSLHHSMSYDVQATRTEVRRYEVADLDVAIIDPRERRVIWRGRFSDRYADGFEPHLGDAIASLLAEVPLRRSTHEGRTVVVDNETSPFLFP